MNQSLPFIPGYSFRTEQDRYVFPRTLVFSKGVALTNSLPSTTAKAAKELLQGQNQALSREQLVELTYGPKREPQREITLPRFLSMDKKVLRFSGYFREDIEDWAIENYRIRPVKVLYYLQNDTMEVIEPKTENSGLLQGTYLKRHAFPHPSGRGRRYLWKDLNLGNDVNVYGVSIRLTDCDQWTREYLINAGIELNDPESIPPDPYQMQKSNILGRKEPLRTDEDKFYKFLTCDRKVLRFYGTWQDVLSDPPEMRRVILQYYLADDALELLEDHAANCGRDPCKVLVRKQKIPVNRNELPASFPLSYMELQDEDLTWFQPKDFRTGKDNLILGKKIFLYDCDEFTRQYYKANLGVEDMESFAVAEKPKPQIQRIYPPHTGIGSWGDSLQNCLSVIPKTLKKDFIKELHFNGVVLRFKSKMSCQAGSFYSLSNHLTRQSFPPGRTENNLKELYIQLSPIEDDEVRRFIFSVYPCDDSVAINEESIPNSGFPGGAFFKRSRLIKRSSDATSPPAYYEIDDFYIGAKIRASGKVFELIDADPYVLSFMEQHPELYSQEHVSIHQQNTVSEKLATEPTLSEKMILVKKLREEIIRSYGPSPLPLPKVLDLGFDVQPKEKIMEALYSANIPVPQDLLNQATDICTDHNNKTDMEELKKILLPAFGHDHL